MKTTSVRYEIGFEGKESYDNVKTFADARRVALNLAKKNPLETIYVFDKMARAGSVELWLVVCGILAWKRRRVQS